MIINESVHWTSVGAKKFRKGQQGIAPGVITGLLGGVPHAGPASNVDRAVMFITAEPKNRAGKNKSFYDQYGQWTCTDLTIVIAKAIWLGKKASAGLKVELVRRLYEAAKKDPLRSINQYVGGWKELGILYRNLNSNMLDEKQLTAVAEKFVEKTEKEFPKKNSKNSQKKTVA